MKYIVEFEDEPSMYVDEVHFYKCIQAPWWGLSEEVIKYLTPYQPDAPDTNVGNITNSCAHENDPISRQMAINALDAACVKYDISPHYDDKRSDKEKFFDWWDMYKVLSMQILNNLPSTQPDHKLTPCRKKLPDKEGDYLVQAAMNGDIFVARWQGSYWNVKTPVVAWMPLPEPYRGGEK